MYSARSRDVSRRTYLIQVSPRTSPRSSASTKIPGSAAHGALASTSLRVAHCHAHPTRSGARADVLVPAASHTRRSSVARRATPRQPRAPQVRKLALRAARAGQMAGNVMDFASFSGLHRIRDDRRWHRPSIWSRQPRRNRHDTRLDELPARGRHGARSCVVPDRCGSGRGVRNQPRHLDLLWRRIFLLRAAWLHSRGYADLGFMLTRLTRRCLKPGGRRTIIRPLRLVHCPKKG